MSRECCLASTAGDVGTSAVLELSWPIVWQAVSTWSRTNWNASTYHRIHNFLFLIALFTLIFSVSLSPIVQLGRKCSPFLFTSSSTAPSEVHVQCIYMYMCIHVHVHVYTCTWTLYMYAHVHVLYPECQKPQSETAVQDLYIPFFYGAIRLIFHV